MEEKKDINKVPGENKEPQAIVFQEKDSKIGPIIGSIIIIFIIAIGGIYFWSTQIEKINTEIMESDNEEGFIEDVNQIDAELEAIDFEAIDSDLQAIDEEFSNL